MGRRPALHRVPSLDPANPSLDEIALPPRLLDLVRLRVALLHDCRLCIETYSELLLERGDAPERLAQLPFWRESLLFDEKEKAALGLADVLASDSPGPVPPGVVREAHRQFNEAEILHLVLTIFAAGDLNFDAAPLADRPFRRGVRPGGGGHS